MSIKLELDTEKGEFMSNNDQEGMQRPRALYDINLWYFTNLIYF